MAEETELRGFQRADLMRQAHHLQPVVTVGKLGGSEEVQRHLENELERRELVKVRFVDHKGSRREIAASLARDTRAFLVATIGNVAVLYRAARDPRNRHITLPERDAP